jgi:hypothetical protein
MPANGALHYPLGLPGCAGMARSYVQVFQVSR